jgi:hypothetical protein
MATRRTTVLSVQLARPTTTKAEEVAAFSRWRLIFLMVAVALLLPRLAAAAGTYYVDYTAGSDANTGTTKTTPWKRAPGMPGFGGAYVHQAGDVMVFKGGVVWPAASLPLTIANSGSSGNVDSYTTDHTWFAGGTWSQPVFDGGRVGTKLIVASGRSYFKVDDLTLEDVGSAATADSYKAVEIANSHNFTLSNNTLRPYSWIGFYIYSTSGTMHSNLIIEGNDISNVGMGLVVATAAANTIIDNVHVRDNYIHDFTSKIGDGVHGDGIHFWGKAGDASQYIRNGRIYNNTFGGSFQRSFGTSGAMTALIYLENVHSPYLVYNNSLGYSDSGVPSVFAALIDLKSDAGNTVGSQIYNNSLYGYTTGMSAGIYLDSVPNVTLRNNILSGMKYCYYMPTGSTSGTTSNYNILNCSDTSAPVGYWGAGFYTFTQWRGLGQDLNGMASSPQYTSAPLNLRPLATSPANGTGINLSSVFNLDLDGRARPSSGSWAIGAYEGGGGASGAPAAPANLRISSE